MFVSVIVWFGCYHAIMTSDKFTFLFGGFAPSTSQLFTMVLRLVPSYQRKLSEIGMARACAGKGVAGGSLRDRVGSSSAIVSSLTSWALENGVVLADSMKSRGYGTGKRTAFALWRFTAVFAASVFLFFTVFFLYDRSVDQPFLTRRSRFEASAGRPSGGGDRGPAWPRPRILKEGSFFI